MIPDRDKELRAIVQAQGDLRSLAFSTMRLGGAQGGKREKRARQWREAINAITLDTSITQTISRTRPNNEKALADFWVESVKTELAIGPIAWWLFWNWILPELIALAKRWIDRQQTSATVTTTTNPTQGRTSDR